MSEPKDSGNFLIEITPELHDQIKFELGDEYTDNLILHYSPYWKELDK